MSLGFVFVGVMAVRNLYNGKVYLLLFMSFQIKGLEVKQVLKWVPIHYVFYIKSQFIMFGCTFL